MSLTRFHMTVITAWFTAIVAIFGVRFAAGVPPTMAEGLLMVLVGVLPTILFVSIFRGAPPRTIAQVLYDGEHAPAVAPRPSGPDPTRAGR